MSGVLDYLSAGMLGGTALALVTFVVCKLSRGRLPAAMLCVLWAIVVLKFVVPFGPSTSFSLSSLLSPAAEQTALPQIGQVEALATTALGGSTPIPWSEGLAALYLLGLAIVVTRRGAKVLATRRTIKQLPTAPCSVTSLAEHVAREVGLRRAVAVNVTDSGQPMLYGVLRPVVVVPRELTTRPTALRAALLHEFSHVRRRDHWLRAVQLVAGAIYYFWPIVAWANRRFDRSREIACDARALAAGKLCPREYGRLLVQLAKAPTTRGLAIAPPPSQLESRVRALVAGRSARCGASASVGLTVWFVFAMAGAAHDSPTAAAALVSECNPDPEIGALIIDHHPEADLDGNGELSKAEICAHQWRMKQHVLDEIIESSRMSQLALAADTNNDGNASAVEVEQLRASMQVDLSDPLQPRLLVQGTPVALSSFADDLGVSSAYTGSRICATARCEDGRPTTYDTRVLIHTKN